VECPARQLLVVSERFHRGWSATCDGRPASVLRVNGDFLGCEVGPGAGERIVLVFRAPGLLCGALVSGLAALGVLALVGRGLAPGRAPRMPSPG
jgi:uncharacterized membrane protein YfhO